MTRQNVWNSKIERYELVEIGDVPPEPVNPVLYVVLVLLLLAIAFGILSVATADAAAPQNYCTSIEVTRPWLPTDPWVITVTAGSGSYWRIREYATGTVVVPAVYDPTIPVTLSGVLVEGVEYQVQSAHSAGGPWSTSGCRFVAPPPLGIDVLSFDAACQSDDVLLEWATGSELNILSFRVDRDGAPVVTVPAQNPGSPAGATYTYLDIGVTGYHVYDLWWWDMAGRQNGTPMVAIVDCAQPTAVRLSSFEAHALGGPLPPLLPAKPGPATRATYRATCSTRYYPTTYPRACVWTWGLR